MFRSILVPLFLLLLFPTQVFAADPPQDCPTWAKEANSNLCYQHRADGHDEGVRLQQHAGREVDLRSLRITTPSSPQSGPLYLSGFAPVPGVIELVVSRIFDSERDKDESFVYLAKFEVEITAAGPFHVSWTEPLFKQLEKYDGGRYRTGPAQLDIVARFKRSSPSTPVGFVPIVLQTSPQLLGGPYELRVATSRNWLHPTLLARGPSTGVLLPTPTGITQCSSPGRVGPEHPSSTCQIEQKYMPVTLTWNLCDQPAGIYDLKFGGWLHGGVNEPISSTIQIYHGGQVCPPR